MRRARYSIGYEIDDKLNIHRVPRAYVDTPKRGKTWDNLRPDHRYSTDYEKSQQGTMWRHREYLD